MASAGTESQPLKEQQTPTDLPKLSLSEFKAYNRLAEHMDLVHNHFRQTWTTMYSACIANRRPAGMSIRQFISTGLDFCRHLDMHHSIEETYFFPLLSPKMPQFQKQEHLLEQHKEIHTGLDLLQAYLERCSSGEHELRLDGLKEIMDGFGKVLWTHLDDEVRTLGAENMRKYWTLQEMAAIAV